MKPLKDYLSEWTDIDVAQYWTACSLGLFKPDEIMQAFRANKSTFWADNKIGTMLYYILQSLTSAGLLEHDEAQSKVRWNSQSN